MKKFVFGTFIYNYHIIKQDRKTLSLTVTPDLRIIVKSPHQAKQERIETFLKRKWFWLEKQISFFKKHQKKIYVKEYISGEGLFYLGRQYTLDVKKYHKNKVEVTKRKIVIYTNKSPLIGKYNKSILDDWYEEKVEKIFTERFEKVIKNFDQNVRVSLDIRDMNKRWGSFLRNKVILNPKLIYVSKNCIDYVITHELCHTKYKKHDTKFFGFLEKKYPGWKKIKEKLEMSALG